jgi:mannose-6-phosphate isomerase-like protein (cupin superfamily)
MASEFVVVTPHTAEALHVGARTILLGPESLSRGSFNVLDQHVPSGLLAAAHRHTYEDQSVLVLSGTLTVWVDGAEQDIHGGEYALRPAGLPHAMWNTGPDPVHMVEITSPAAGFESYMRRISEMNANGGADQSAITALAAGAGITFLPEITAELQARTGTSPAGGFWKK